MAFRVYKYILPSFEEIILMVQELLLRSMYRFYDNNDNDNVIHEDDSTNKIENLIDSFDNDNNNNNNILFGVIILIRILICLRTLISNIRNGDALIPTTMHCTAYRINDCSKLTSG